MTGESKFLLACCFVRAFVMESCRAKGAACLSGDVGLGCVLAFSVCFTGGAAVFLFHSSSP